MDPFPPDLGLQIPPQLAQADVMTTSNTDAFHSALDSVESSVVLEGPGEYEAAGMHLRGVRTTRRTPEGQPQSWNTMFVAEIEGIVVCHLGNPDKLLTNRQVQELGSPHVLMVPAGSDTGISSADAVEIINSVEPKIVIPMLYAHGGNKATLRELSPFLREMGIRQPEAQARLTVNRSSVPDETQLVVLQPAATLL
jgi:L-ascorbate metabolism protein UlaG (beta-lactamase superfamily)